ncbi:TIGR04255 family protein [Burkholderia multivorans]|uniref:TIGR04255 family protein n=1 Tax=Burkholderia multivorans TaxID=87883 RepID=UPI0012DCE049|nr:TIGR04255 family protein [Burkholderia multivorans]QGR87744.1 TIGR04255 family protein [Burkholderia multivorans]
MTISFSAPPINEVVIGKVFEPQPRFLVPYYGRFWDLIQNDFPACEHAQPLVDAGSEPLFDQKTGALLPRVWFVSADKTRLLQVQNDRFHCNWRQTDGTQAYARFATIYDQYRKYADLFQTFLLSQLNAELVPRRCEVSYVNIFRKGKEWEDWGDLNGLFKDIRLPAKVEGGDIGGAFLHLNYKMPNEGGTLAVSIGSAKLLSGEDAIRMELAASSPKPKPDAGWEHDWFQLAHKAIIQSFCDLTTDSMQKTVWKRET